MSKMVRMSKWGNCLAVRIPSFIADNLNLTPGDSAELSYSFKDQRIIIEFAGRFIDYKTAEARFDEVIRQELHNKGVPGY